MPLRNLRKLWTSSKQKSTDAESDCERPEAGCELRNVGPQLPLLQVWPSQDSPECAKTSGQHFIFKCEDRSSSSVQQNDSGIDSVQASPSPRPSQCFQSEELSPPTPTNRSRRTSCSYLHPNHARLIKALSPSEHVTVEEATDCSNLGSGSSSTASSMASIAGVVPHLSARHSDPWDRRRSSVMTARYSLFDALDLEYALLRAATRSSIGQSSLSQSIHKLTFTQSLAFPALAKGLAGKRRPSHVRSSSRVDATESGLNAAAKIITVIVLFAVSLLVFGIVFKYVRT